MRKHLVFVSGLGLALPRGDDDVDLASAASNARVVIDYVHTAGTFLDPSHAQYTVENKPTGRGMAPTIVNTQERQPPPLWTFGTARTLASLTGGRFYANQFRNASITMDHIDEATRSGYLLGYYPPNPGADGKFRRIKVTVKRPGVTVLSRHGYFATATSNPVDVRAAMIYSRIAAASNYAKALTAIGVRGTASVSRQSQPDVRVLLDVSIDPAHVDVHECQQPACGVNRACRVLFRRRRAARRAVLETRRPDVRRGALRRREARGRADWVDGGGLGAPEAGQGRGLRPCRGSHRQRHRQGSAKLITEFHRAF